MLYNAKLDSKAEYALRKRGTELQAFYLTANYPHSRVFYQICWHSRVSLSIY
jgi:hypothetical protein